MFGVNLRKWWKLKRVVSSCWLCVVVKVCDSWWRSKGVEGNEDWGVGDNNCKKMVWGNSVKKCLNYL